MASPNIVGRLGIKVTPVMKHFRKELKAKAIAAAKSVEPIEVNAHVDADGLRGELNRAVRMAEKQVRDAKVGVDLSGIRKARAEQLKQMRKDYDNMPSGLDRMGPYHELQRMLNEKFVVKMEPDRKFFDQTRTLFDGLFERTYKGKVNFELDEDSDAGWARLKSKMDKAFLNHKNYEMKIDVDVDVENGNVDRALNRIRNEFRRRAFNAEDIKFEIKPEMSDHELREMGHKLKRLKDKWDDTEIEFHLSLDHSDRYVAMARLAWLGRDRIVKLKPLVDNKSFQVAATTLAALSGGRLVKDLGSRIWDLVKNLDKATPTFGAVASSVAGLAAGAVQLLKNTIGVAGSLGHIVQMVGLLGPGFLAAGGVLGAAFVVPMFKASEHIQDILDDWSALSSEMGSGFWNSAMKDFTSAHQRAFQSFHNDMVDMSSAAGKHFGKVSDSISRIVAPRFHEWVSHASAGLEEMGRHADSLAVIVDVLGRHGSRSLEDFLGWLGRISTDYANWLTEAERTGKLSMMIDRGVQSMKDLGRAAKNVGRTLSGIYEVAVKFGGADLGSMADGLGKWADVTHSSGFQTNLGHWFKGMGEAWANLKAESASHATEFLASWSRLMVQTGGKMGSAAGKMLSGVTRAFSGRQFNLGFDKFFDGLNKGLDSLDAVWPRVATGLGELLKVMGSFASGFAPVIGSVLESAVRVAERLGPIISSIVETAGPRMAAAVESWTSIALPFLEVAARMVDGLAKIPGAVEAVTAAFVGWKVLSTASSLIGALKKSVEHLPGDLTKAAGAVKQFVGSSGLGGVKGAATGAASALAGLGVAGGVAVGAVAAVGAGLAVVAYRDSAATKRALGELRVAFDDAADGGARAAERMSAAITKMAQGDMWGSVRNTVVGLNTSFDLLGQGKAGQFGARFFSNSKAMSDADAINDMFVKIGEIAEQSSVKATNGLQAMREAFSMSGVESQKWTAELERQLDVVPGLESSLSNLAQYIGFAGDRSGVLAMVASNVNTEWMVQQVNAQRLADTTSNLNTILDQTASQFGMTHDQARATVDIVSQMAPAFIDFGAAAVDANGNAVESINQVASNLREQEAAYSQWADNVQSLMERGVSQGVIAELSKLPNGTALVKEFAAQTGAEFEATKDSLNASAAAMGGAVDVLSANFQEMASTTGTSFESLKASVEQSLGQLPGTANIKGAETVEQLSEALSAGGYSIESVAGQWVLSFGNGIDPAKSVALSTGQEVAQNFVDPLSEIDVTGPADGVMAQFGDRFRSGGEQAAAAWRDQVTSSMAEAGTAVEGAISGVTSGLNNALTTGLNPGLSAQAAAQWVTGVSTGIGAAAASAGTMGQQIATNLNAGLTAGLANSQMIGMQFGMGLVMGVRAGTAGVQAAVVQVVQQAVAGIRSGQPQMQAGGLGLATGLAMGFRGGSSAFLAAVTQALTVAKTQATTSAATFTTVGNKISTSIAAGVRQAGGTVNGQVVSAVVGAIHAGYGPAGAASGIGVAIGSGIARGISSQSGAIQAAAASAVRSAISAAKAAGDIHSPSRKTHWVGQMLGLGAENGIWDSVPGIENAAGAMVAVMLASLKAGSERAEGIMSTALEPVGATIGSQSFEVEHGSQMLAVDPRSFEGANMTLRVGEEEFQSYVEDVSAGVVTDYDDARRL